MDDKKNTQTQPEKPQEFTAGEPTWVDDMKQDLEDYLEEQGIYIRQ